MNKNADKTIERLVDKIMKDTSVESPSFHFTDNIMSQIEALQKSDVTTYKPLISKSVWVFILLSFTTLIGYFVFGTKPETSSWFSSVDFSVLSNNQVTDVLSNITVSKTVTYAVLLFALMFCIQIPLLKNHFNKRLEF